MNIEDVKDLVVPNNPIEAIFIEQGRLMEKYDDIERRNGFSVPHHPSSLDDKYTQARLKDLFWRVTEEIAEAAEATGEDWHCIAEVFKRDPTGHALHFVEEIADALHFMAEAAITIGFETDAAADLEEGIKQELVDEEAFSMMMTIIVKMGLAANCLKNKPWKCTHMPTDKGKFIVKHREIWLRFGNLFALLGMDTDDVYRLYMRKNHVNRFRQASNY